MKILRQVKYAGMAAIALTMLAALILLAGIAIPAQAQTETLLYQFTGAPDGAQPKSGVVLKGTTLYGTTWEGGSSNSNFGGTVYTVSTTTGKEKILHSFTTNTQPPYDGIEPLGGVVFDKEGNLYGTTIWGGGYDGAGYGTIYEITKKGAESVLYAFQGGTDGAYPEWVTPVLDKEGNLYGTTLGGSYGAGNVFKFGSAGLTTLYNFTGLADGGTPVCGVTLDTKGNIYGVAAAGGAYGYGVLFEITAAGAYSVLYNFTGGADGSRPYSPPVFKSGKLYGTTMAGGSSGCTEGCGVIYEYTLAKGKKEGEETVLHTFNGTDGYHPMYGTLVFDKLGNIYGTTESGGPTNLGNVYELAKDGTLTTLYNFDQQPDGYAPMGGVVFDTKGNLYTTAAFGGNNSGEYGDGTVIKITP
ncbi:MAG: choice-of-anchor tandem repeat GloVer-containing protein [Terriglobales bacterium]|jgi:uncharacterized repeat protein (TIGR03803 family)